MTIKEIAKLANVSLGTVDRVIHKRGKVSKKTEEKVSAIIKKVNYQPNIYARGLVLNKSYDIIALVPSFVEGEYWEMPSKGIKMAEKNLSKFGIKLEILYFDQNSVPSFIEKADELIKLKPDGVILAPVINFEAAKLTKKLEKANIPFSLIDSNIPNSNALSFIGQDAFQSGKLAAKLMCSEIKAQGTISIITIKNNENHNKTLQQRIEGFKDYIYNSDFIADISLTENNIHLGSANWEECLTQACNPDNDTVGIFVPSSMIHYVAKCIESNVDTMGNIKLIGNDLIANNVKYLKKGIINYLIGQRPENQGYLALESFYKHLVLEKQVPSEKYLPLDIITQENLMYYNDDDVVSM
ncbi:substrate-binding domain-containing protein [Galbibacter sp. EGI 63066]|uniref:substrate-binding domain-containing protein n=1 Tax=Galbibacter sp. EGI 63066 TaxID=2993559 RepID=UPI002248C748|nr:substrate-binding domain-containing protein [Galbibacter sp. EGI 63066]MCX2680862.1 substrate-binding domain-containing protein [Galbibacter sp. EGI 63066]